MLESSIYPGNLIITPGNYLLRYIFLLVYSS